MDITRIGASGDITRNSVGSSDRGTTEEALPIDGYPEVPNKNETIEKGELKDAVGKMNDVFDALATHLKFTYHEATGKYYVSIVNENTNKVVREIPPKKFLDMVAYFEKQMKGIFVDEIK